MFNVFSGLFYFMYTPVHKNVWLWIVLKNIFFWFLCHHSKANFLGPKFILVYGLFEELTICNHQVVFNKPWMLFIGGIIHIVDGCFLHIKFLLRAVVKSESK